MQAELALTFKTTCEMKTIKISLALCLTMLVAVSIYILLNITTVLPMSVTDYNYDEARQFQIGFLLTCVCMGSGLVVLVLRSLED